MTVLDRIKETARLTKGISLTMLEKELGFSNGSLAKAKDIPSGRIKEIASFLDVSIDYLMTGEDKKSPAPKFEADHIKLIAMYSKLNKEQKEAVFNLLRSFCSE